MTEAEWVTTNKPLYMLREYPAAWNVQKARLFWCACLRRDWGHSAEEGAPDERTKHFVELAETNPENVGDELASQLEAENASYQALFGGPYSHPHYWLLRTFSATLPYSLMNLVRQTAEGVARRAANLSGQGQGSGSWLKSFDEAEVAEKVCQCQLIREIFGNPFRPVSLDPWRTSDVLALAQQMYDSRDFGAMPLLADALQDAGCDNVNVLDHCRDPGEHVRGCWVIDLLLGK